MPCESDSPRTYTCRNPIGNWQRTEHGRRGALRRREGSETTEPGSKEKARPPRRAAGPRLSGARGPRRGCRLLRDQEDLGSRRRVVVDLEVTRQEREELLGPV